MLMPPALGDYNRPSVRVAGSGGANDIGSSVGRYSVMMRQEKRRFVERVDYLTVPVTLTGEMLGLRLDCPGEARTG
ncbi:MAG: hypothetical protein ACOX2B_10455 [Syntrophothermaceae bacterium]